MNSLLVVIFVTKEKTMNERVELTPGERSIMKQVNNACLCYTRSQSVQKLCKYLREHWKITSAVRFAKTNHRREQKVEPRFGLK